MAATINFDFYKSFFPPPFWVLIRWLSPLPSLRKDVAMGIYWADLNKNWSIVIAACNSQERTFVNRIYWF